MGARHHLRRPHANAAGGALTEIKIQRGRLVLELLVAAGILREQADSYYSEKAKR